jgi:hypothetical protein
MAEVNAPNVLRILRDHGPNSVDGLRKELSIDTLSGVGVQYALYDLENALRQLREAGLVVEADPAGTYEIAPNWPRAQAVLGISLKELGKKTSDSVVVKPFFGKPAGIGTPLDIFVVMSFKPKFRPIYEDHILNVAKGLNLTAKRADDFFGAHHIMGDVWEAINAARFVIADCTERNANVFYEIGMAHTVGRTVILITQEAKDVPFDLQAIRYIHYEYTPPGMKTFEKTLAQTLQAELVIHD